MSLAIAIILLLGIANFAMHRAVLDSGGPMLEQVPTYIQRFGGRLTLGAEFLVLLAAALLAANGWPELAWAYLAYTILNAFSAWLILTERI